jgi:hypothetical protein
MYVSSNYVAVGTPVILPGIFRILPFTLVEHVLDAVNASSDVRDYLILGE